MGTLRIVLVDDHDLTRETLHELVVSQPDWEVVAEAVNGEEAVNQVKRLAPDVVVMDMQMPGMNGMEATRAIAANKPSSRILIVSNYVDSSLVKAVLEAGASGYIHKHAAYEELIPGIQAVAAGKRYLCDSVKQLILLFD